MTQPPGTVLSFYALCDFGWDLVPVYRPGTGPQSLEESLAALVAGVTVEEEEFGFSTGFDFVDESDQIDVVVDIDREGIVHLDFRLGEERWHPGSRASTSYQLFSFFDPMEAVVFSHPGVDGLDRSTLCWGESDCRGVTSRAMWEGALFINTGILNHGGCSLELAWWYPDQCTLDGVLQEPTQTASVTNLAADDTLNVRAGPGVEYPRVAELAPGVPVEVTTRTAETTDGALWQLTSQGWANARFLDGPDACDPAPISAIATDALKAARLEDPDTAWETSPDGGVFGARTTDPEQLAATLGYECSWQATQQAGDTERLVVAAWTGHRVSMVIQATDNPVDPFLNERTVDILIDDPAGEMVADDTWAVTLPEGESLIVLTRNTTNLGWVAKSWLGEYVYIRDDNPTGTAHWTTTEQMAIPALRAAGGRNVSIAEDSHGSLVTVISLVSPSGDEIFATVGPADQLEPYEYLPGGNLFHEVVGGTEIRLLDPTEGYPASAATLVCDDFIWVFEASDGQVPETFSFLTGLISTLGCK